ncbi:MAG: hypothetical protein V3R94_03225 [Acidobacteriota bacterium]
MKRIFLTLSLLSLMVLSPIAAQQVTGLVAQQGYADLVLINGKIVSMEDRSTTPNTTGRIVQAMAIKGKKIMALGTEQEMRALSGSNTRIVDVGGRTGLPGVIQTHYHIFGTAARVFGPQNGLTDDSINLKVMSGTSAEATAVKVRDAILNAIQVQQIPDGQWISVDLQDNPQNRPATTRTWLYRGAINRRQFDGAIKQHPILVRRRRRP